MNFRDLEHKTYVGAPRSITNLLPKSPCLNAFGVLCSDRGKIQGLMIDVL